MGSSLTRISRISLLMSFPLERGKTGSSGIGFLLVETGSGVVVNDTDSSTPIWRFFKEQVLPLGSYMPELKSREQCPRAYKVKLIFPLPEGQMLPV